MEQLTKRILAIVLIAVIGIGVGITVWVFVAPYAWGSKDCPGAPAGLTEDQIIKIGVLGGLYDIQGIAAEEGAILAAKDINTAGGIVVNGKTYYIGITAEDTDESNPNLDTTKGVAAAERILNYKRCQYLTGGFRTESLVVYLETIVNAQKLFINTGAATDDFCQAVLDDYPKYKYFFRNCPINSSSLGVEAITYLLTYATVLNVHKFALIYEDLDWTTDTVGKLKAYLPALGAGLPAGAAEVVAEIAYPITAIQSDFDGYMSTIETNGTQILIPLISAQGGILMMSSYASQHPGFVVIGIDVQSQLDTFWTDSLGNCEFETILQILHRTNKTDLSIPFWDAYIAEFGHEPLYIASGSYDAIKMYAWGINETQSFDTDILITQFETVDTTTPLAGVGGFTAFTGSHDIQEGHPYGYAMFCQWQAAGTKIVTTSYNAVYPDSLVTGSYQLPDWSGWAFNPN